MNRVFAFSSFFLLLFLSACIENNTAKTETKTINFDQPFNVIFKKGVGEVDIISGNKQKLTIKGEPERIEKVETTLKDSQLRIEDLYTGKKTSKLKFIIEVKELKSLTVAGSHAVTIQSLKNKVFSLNLSGSNAVTAQLETDQFSLDANGSNAITINGSADMQKLTLSGSTNYNGKNFRSKYAHVLLSGSPLVTLNVQKKIFGQADGNSQIHYVGNPIIAVQTSGISSTKKL